MKILIENTKITTKELCDWFGIASSTYANNKQKYQAILSEYCDFEILSSRTILIKHIYNPEEAEYVKVSTKLYKYLEDNLQPSWNEYDTVPRVAAQLYINAPDNLKHEYKYSTFITYLRKIKIQKYGPAQQGTWTRVEGEIGKATPIAAIAKRKYIPLTIEQLDFVETAIREYFNAHIGLEVLNLFQKQVDTDLNDGEAWRELKNTLHLDQKSYQRFMFDLVERFQERFPGEPCSWILKAYNLINEV